MRHDQEFSDLFRSRYDWARRTAYALCGNWKEAEEITQAAFVRLYGQWSRIRRESECAYLRTILTRVFLDTRRRARARETPVADLPESSAHQAGADISERQLLVHALQQIPPGQRAVLVLRFMHDLSVDQTARELKCSVGTVKSQTNRGLIALREVYHKAAESEVLDAR